MICLFYAIYYIIFIRILDYVIFLKKKLPQGLYFEKKVLFFVFAFTVNVFVLVSFYLSITFSTILYNVYFFH